MPNDEDETPCGCAHGGNKSRRDVTMLSPAWRTSCHGFRRSPSLSSTRNFRWTFHVQHGNLSLPPCAYLRSRRTLIISALTRTLSAMRQDYHVRTPPFPKEVSYPGLGLDALTPAVCDG